MHYRICALTVALLACAQLAFAAQSTRSTPDYAAVGRGIVNALATRQFDKVLAAFSDSHSVALSAQRIANGWDRLIARLGAFHKIQNLQVDSRHYHVATANCLFDRGSLRIVMFLDDAGRLVGLRYLPGLPETEPGTASTAEWSPPPYADPKAFHEVPVTVADGQWHLPGTLSVPNSKSPAPAVVLVAGSGPEDADATLGPNKPLKDLAWGLASRGIAVLRYPKRTYKYGAASAIDPKRLTVKDEYIDDARAAVALLATRPEIDPKRIFLAGHSEGGYLAPRIAKGDARIAGIVILEGPTQPVERAVLEQLRYLASLGGPNAAAIEQQIPTVEQEVRTIESPTLKPWTSMSLAGVKLPSSYILDLRDYDPAAVAKTLSIPINVVQGGRDYQVTMKDFAGWKKTLIGRSNVTLKLYPSLDHLLMPGAGPSTPQEYLVPGHVSAEVISDLAAWVSAH